MIAKNLCVHKPADLIYSKYFIRSRYTTERRTDLWVKMHKNCYKKNNNHNKQRWSKKTNKKKIDQRSEFKDEKLPGNENGVFFIFLSCQVSERDTKMEIWASQRAEESTAKRQKAKGKMVVSTSQQSTPHKLTCCMWVAPQHVATLACQPLTGKYCSCLPPQTSELCLFLAYLNTNFLLNLPNITNKIISYKLPLL